MGGGGGGGFSYGTVLSLINTHVTYETSPFAPDEEEEDDEGRR